MLKQLETLKKEKEKFAQELQMQRLAASKLAKLNEVKRQLAELQEELDELQYLHTIPPQPPLPGLATNDTPIIHPNPSFVGHNTPTIINTYTTVDKSSPLSLGLQTAP